MQFVVDDFLVADGVDRAVDMGDVIIVETAQHVDDCIGFAYVGKEFVAEPFTLACAFYKAGYVDDFDSCGHHAARVAHLYEFVKPLVGHGYHTYVGFDCTEREVGRLRFGIRQAVKQGRLPHVGKPHDSALQ